MSNNTILVAIVAVVAIGFLVSEFGQVSNLTGDAYRAPLPTPTYTPPSTCTDSDGGLDYNTAGTVTYGTRTFTDRCDGIYLSERYCSSSNYASTQKFLCPGSCLTTKEVGSRCVAAPAPTISCADDMAGTVTYGTRTFTDQCVGSLLIDFSCSGNNAFRQRFSCSGSCVTDTNGIGHCV